MVFWFVFLCLFWRFEVRESDVFKITVKYLDGIRELSATLEAGFAKIIILNDQDLGGILKLTSASRANTWTIDWLL